MARLTAVTVTFNGATVWKPFLRCVLEQTHPDWELIVVDNVSTDGTRAMLAEIDDPRVLVIANDTNVGIATGNNQGIALARSRGAEAVLLINNDTEFGPALFADLEVSLQTTEAAAISPLITYYHSPDLVWFAGGVFDRYQGIRNIHVGDRRPIAAFPREPFRTEHAPACCLLIRSDVFDQIGSIDERYFVYWEDADFNWRMKLAGLPIYVDPQLRLAHKVSVSTGGALSNFTIRYYHRNQIVFARKFHGLGWTAYTLLAMTLAALARVALRGDRPHHARRRISAMIEGLGVPLSDARHS